LALVKPADQTRRLLRVKDSIDARYAEPLDVRAIARIAGISTAHFSRQFRQAFGESPHQYLRSRRMERAAALLRSTDDPVRDICRRVGLRSVGSFTTSFGRAYGLSPAAYRASHPRGTVAAAIPSCALRKWARPRPRARAYYPTRGGALSPP
jgi:AraC-like DNA-binding protein